MCLSKEELNWCRRMKKALKDRPASLRLYVVDNDLSISKNKIPSNDFNWSLGDIHGSGIYINDLHDKLNNNEEPL